MKYLASSIFIATWAAVEYADWANFGSFPWKYVPAALGFYLFVVAELERRRGPIRGDPPGPRQDAR